MISAFLPWFVLAMLKLRDSPLYLIAAAILFGLGVAEVYPHLNFFILGTAGLGLVIHQRKCLIGLVARHRLHVVVAILLMGLAVLPFCYVAYHLPNLRSFVRPTVIQAQTLDEYMALNREQGYSSAPASYFLQYVEPWFLVGDDDVWGTGDDRCALFVGRPCLLLALLALVQSPKRALPVAAYGLIGMMLTMGINAPINLPKWLFLLHFPAIGGYRQWYQFHPMLTVALAALAALGAAGAMNPLTAPSPWRNLVRKGVLVLLPLAILDLVLYCLICGVTYCQPLSNVDFGKGTDQRPSKEPLPTYCQPLPDLVLGSEKMRLISGNHLPSQFMYKNRFDLNAGVGSGTLVNGPLLTNIVAVNNDGCSEELDTLRDNLVSRKQFVTVVNGPLDVLQRNFIPLTAARFLENCTDWTLGPSGIEIHCDAPSPAFLLTPMNYDLKPIAYLDGEKAQILRANGAMAGVVVPTGKHTVVLRVGHDWYTVFLAIQVALTILLPWLFWRGARGSRPQSPPSPTDVPGTTLNATVAAGVYGELVGPSTDASGAAMQRAAEGPRTGTETRN